MSDAREQKVEVKKEAPDMPLGVAMDMAEFATKGTSAKQRAELEGELKTDGKLKVAGVESKTVKLTPEQKEIVNRLNAAKNSKERVEIFARLADDNCLDPLISLIPELGDAGSSILSGLYLLYEANKAGLGAVSYLKIIGLQAADFFAGAIPVVGDLADYFFKANKWSVSSFEEKTKALVVEARNAGVPEEEIAKITGSAEKLPKLVDRAVRLYSTKQGGALS